MACVGPAVSAETARRRRGSVGAAPDGVQVNEGGRVLTLSSRAAQKQAGGSGLGCRVPTPAHRVLILHLGQASAGATARPARRLLRCRPAVCAGVGARACAAHTAPARVNAAGKGNPGDRLGPQAGAAVCSAGAPSPLPHGLLPTACEVPFEAWQVHVAGNAVTLGHMTPPRGICQPHPLPRSLAFPRGPHSWTEM